MSENNEQVSELNTAGLDKVHETLDKFLDTANVNTVYGKPVRRENHTIIPAAEVVVGMGFGSGMGGGGNSEDDNGFGGGGGGGGRTLSRPVAVVVASQDGVHIQPIMDITKVALAGLTAFGFIFSTLLKMKSGKITED